jgi:hypothetical protein
VETYDAAEAGTAELNIQEGKRTYLSVLIERRSFCGYCTEESTTFMNPRNARKPNLTLNFSNGAPLNRGVSRGFTIRLGAGWN